MGLHKITKIVMGVLGLIGLILAGVVATVDGESLKNEIKAVGIQEVEIPSSINVLIFIAQIVLVICVLLVVLFVIKGLLNGGNTKNTLIGLGAFVLIVAISYLLASGEATQLRDGNMLSASSARWVSAGLNTFYILAILAIAAMVGGGLKKLIKG